MSLERYCNVFASLKADAKPYWPEATFHRAPYKPLLLLSIMDLMAQDVIVINLIRFDANLIDAFDLYWTRIFGNDRESNPVMPFNHLRSERFWRLVDIRGEIAHVEHLDRNEVFRRIRNQELLARFDDELFTLLRTSDSRDLLRRVLIEQYFVPDVRPAIVEAGQITVTSFEYSRDLLNRTRGRFILRESPSGAETYQTEVRSAGFRRVVVEAYNHTCAICRVRIVTPEGRTSVAAAHIVPWSHSHNDDPRNGMALCGLHHWVFDQGLIGVTPDFAVTISTLLTSEEQTAHSVLAYEGQTIHKPEDRVLWPARDALRWHLNNLFRPVTPDKRL